MLHKTNQIFMHPIGTDTEIELEYALFNVLNTNYHIYLIIYTPNSNKKKNIPKNGKIANHYVTPGGNRTRALLHDAWKADMQKIVVVTS